MSAGLAITARRGSTPAPVPNPMERDLAAPQTTTVGSFQVSSSRALGWVGQLNIKYDKNKEKPAVELKDLDGKPGTKELGRLVGLHLYRGTIPASDKSVKTQTLYWLEDQDSGQRYPLVWRDKGNTLRPLDLKSDSEAVAKAEDWIKYDKVTSGLDLRTKQGELNGSQVVASQTLTVNKQLVPLIDNSFSPATWVGDADKGFQVAVRSALDGDGKRHFFMEGRPKEGVTPRWRLVGKDGKPVTTMEAATTRARDHLEHWGKNTDALYPYVAPQSEGQQGWWGSGFSMSSLAESAKSAFGIKTRAGPDRGLNACVYAVNRIFHDQLGIRPPWGDAVSVPKVRNILANGAGKQLSGPRPGAIVIFRDSGNPPFPHIGIVQPDGKIISNSSSSGSFTWVATPAEYTQHYGRSPEYWALNIPSASNGSGQDLLGRLTQTLFGTSTGSASKTSRASDISFGGRLTHLPRQALIKARALLNTIRYAEGTWRNGSDDGYSVLFGGSQFNDFTRHPYRVISSGRYNSAAAGAYQFMPFTWGPVARQLRLPNFGPLAQDLAALSLVTRRGVQISQNFRLTNKVLAKLAPEWASFPLLNGRSNYSQPVKGSEELIAFYNREVARLSRQHGVNMS